MALEGPSLLTIQLLLVSVISGHGEVTKVGLWHLVGADLHFLLDWQFKKSLCL